MGGPPEFCSTLLPALARRTSDRFVEDSSLRFTTTVAGVKVPMTTEKRMSV